MANYPMDAWKALGHAMDPLWSDEQGAQLVVELLKVRCYCTVCLRFFERVSAFVLLWLLCSIGHLLTVLLLPEYCIMN